MALWAMSLTVSRVKLSEISLDFLSYGMVLFPIIHKAIYTYTIHLHQSSLLFIHGCYYSNEMPFTLQSKMELFYSISIQFQMTLLSSPQLNQSNWKKLGWDFCWLHQLEYKHIYIYFIHISIQTSFHLV